MSKLAKPDHPILEPIAERWSPRAFAEQPVEREKLLGVLEAARWAASSFNLQPWHFLVAEKADARAFETMLGCLREGNQSWAKHAPVLMITVVKTRIEAKGDKPERDNKQARHDLGLAVGNLSLQAVALDLYVHEMGGIYPEKVRERYRIPEGFEPVTGLALGYLGKLEQLPEDLQKKEQARRSRKALAEFVFAGTWGEAATWTKP